jgi:hypothetical protein
MDQGNSFEGHENILRSISDNADGQHHRHNNVDRDHEIAIPVISSHTEDPYDLLIPALRSHQPHSLPLLRRIQHAIADPSPTAYFLATPLPDVSDLSSSGSSSSEPWLAAFVDLYAGKETQVWAYSSLEAEAESLSPSPSSGDDNLIIANFSGISSEKRARARAQLFVLLSFIKTKLLPEYLSSLSSSSASSIVGSNNTNKNSHATTTASLGVASSSSSSSLSPPKIAPHPPQAFLLGSLHTGLFALLKKSGSYTDPTPLPGLKILRHDVFYVKYLFPPSVYVTPNDDCAGHPLPPGYRYHDRNGRYGVLEHHLDLVIGRTHIPRARSTLLKMPSAVIYHDDHHNPGSHSSSITTDGSHNSSSDEMPIAWGFTSTDGSLATLHVEPEHRGQGLAVTLSKEIMRRSMMQVEKTDGMRKPFFWISGFPSSPSSSSDNDKYDDHDFWAHADVATTNVASRRVMEKIGGQRAWTVTWTVLELCDDV